MRDINFLKLNADFTIEENFDFAKHSSIGVGGKAKFAFYPQNPSQLQELMHCLETQEVDYIVLGNLTNVLPTDKDIQKAVICTKKMLESQSGSHNYFSAGILSGSLLKTCRVARKSGVEFLAGIPCTLGGALYMNAGVNGRYIAELVDSVIVYREGKIISLSQEECAYSYKNSVFMQNKDIILGAMLSLTDSDEKRIREVERSYLERRAHLPKGKSMGCVFKNPNGTNGLSAGAWIEKAGLKGLRQGGAYVSETHANFIINEGTAAVQDICFLIEKIKQEVYKQFQIKLEEEIRYLE